MAPRSCVIQAIKSTPHIGWADHDGLLDPIELRRLRSGDSLDHLTKVLHRAFSRLGDMGIPCSSVNQPTALTRQRVEPGDCFVAVCEERIVGTITLYAPDVDSCSRHYRNARVALLRS